MNTVRSAMVLTVAVLMAASAGGCTRLTVTKVCPTADDSAIPGVRYALPRTFFSLVSQSDGSVTVDRTYLPDSANTYAVDASSIASTHSLTVKVAGGLLTEVDWQPDPTAIPGAGIAAAAELTKARFDAAAAERKSTQDKIDTATKAVDDADLELFGATTKLNRAKSALAALPAGADAGARKAAEDAVSKAQEDVDAAQLKLDVAKEALNRVQGKPSPLTRAPTSRATAPATNLTAVPAPPPAIPILFQVVEDDSGVYLRGVGAK
jgi:hypothetical protein